MTFGPAIRNIQRAVKIFVRGNIEGGLKILGEEIYTGIDRKCGDLVRIACGA